MCKKEYSISALRRKETMNVENIGEFLKKLRKEKNLTQEQLAGLCGLAKSKLAKYENVYGLSNSHPSVEDFFRCLNKQAGSGSGISTGTIHKLRKIAVKEGFLEG